MKTCLSQRMTGQENVLDRKLKTGVFEEVIFEPKHKGEKAAGPIWAKQGELKGLKLNMILS